MPQEKKTEFRIFLKSAMQSCDFTQAQLAEKSGTTQATISRYVRGEGMPRSEELLRISRALGVSMEWLLCGETGRDSRSHSSPNKATLSLAAKKALRNAQAALDTLKSELEPDG